MERNRPLLLHSDRRRRFAPTVVGQKPEWVVGLTGIRIGSLNTRWKEPERMLVMAQREYIRYLRFHEGLSIRAIAKR
ncbi:MAG: hypothetical protein ACM3VX_08090, partial [Bacteroidota bacterium]